MTTVLIYATRVTSDGTSFSETVRVPGSAMIPIIADWFTSMVPAVDVVQGMIIQCHTNSDDILMIDRVTIFEA